MLDEPSTKKQGGLYVIVTGIAMELGYRRQLFKTMAVRERSLSRYCVEWNSLVSFSCGN
jgi:hypothetical protein